MAKTKTTLVVGAGAVGTNAALALDKLGVNVVLAHNGNDIYAGSAANTAFIWHETGQEYCREGHQQTGELCIAGAATQRLMLPMDFLSTGVCNPENPVKFYVSEASTTEGAPYDSQVPVETFRENVEHMRRYFQEKIYNPTKAFYKETDEQTITRLGCSPESFSREFAIKDAGIARNVAIGYTATGDGINMPHVYAYQKAAFRESKVKQEFNTTIKSVNKTNSGQYDVALTNGKIITVDSIILAAGVGNPELVAKIPDAAASVRGTYYLNTMTHIKLPEGGDSEQIIFTLQQQFGGALTCIDKASGRYVVYSPDPSRSQVGKHVYEDKEQKLPPKDWDIKMQTGLDITSQRVVDIIRHTSETYPILKEAEIIQAPLRVVFNADSKDSKDGLDRRVRAMNNKEVAPAVFVTHGPKFTNSLLTALTVAHQAMLSMGMPGLPVSQDHGVGPLDIDIQETAEKINFRNVKGVKLSDAAQYALRYGLPLTMIKNNSPEFERQSIKSVTEAGSLRGSAMQR
jgi:hypothetical protein